MEKEKQIRKGMKVLVGIFCIIACAAIGYTAFDLFYTKPKTNYVSEQKEVEKEVKEEIVEEKEATLTALEEEKIMKVINNLPTKYEKLGFNDMNNQEKLWVAFYLADNRAESKELAETTITKFFGIDAMISMEDMLAYCSDPTCEDQVFYSYNEQSTYFEPVTAFGLPRTVSANKILDSKMKEGKYIITVARLFYALPGAPFPGYTKEDFYVDGTLSTKLQGITDDSCALSGTTNDLRCEPETVLEKMKDGLNTYTYIFDINNGDPVFVNYSKN